MSKENKNKDFNWALAAHGVMVFIGAAIAAPTLVPAIQTIEFVRQIEPCLSVEPDLSQALCALRDYSEFVIKYNLWHEPIIGLLGLFMAGVGSRGIWIEGQSGVSSGDK